ncbi:MAG: FliM/FliN family flagellar motor C-terminal domain-containing protein, partial [Sulfitobacter sp.]
MTGNNVGQGNAVTMSAEQMTSLVQRKARTGSEAHAARAMSLARALRLSAAQQADQLMGLPLSALSVTRRQIGSEDVEDCLVANWLMLLMDGAGGQVATVLLDAALVEGLIQQQTMGKVRPAVEGAEPRKHTATDAALCAPYIENVLMRASKLPEEEADRDLLNGYRFGVWAQDTQQAKLAMDASTYNVVEMTVDLAAGARAGKIMLVMPEPARIAPVSDQDDEEQSQPAQGEKLTHNVMQLHAELTIALSRLKMPIQKVSELKVGDVLNLQVSSMAQALVLDANGRALSRGTLGQVDGMRAVQVEQQKSKQHTQPRRRASDRADLDLPDVTAPVEDGFDAQIAAEDASIPSVSEVDIFGDMDDLPVMPDMD